jgi:hypothetical protein
MTCGSIMLVRYPFTDDSDAKLRPALIVSGDNFNDGEDRIVLPISSSPKSDGQYAVAIRAAHPDFKRTGLRTESFIKWTKPFTATSLP